MLPARALFYALVISLLIAMVSGLLINLSFLLGMQQTDQFEEERLIRNLRSGIAIAQANKGEIPARMLDLFGSGTDSVFIKRMEWGLYDAVSVKSFQSSLNRGKSIYKTFFLGESNNGAISSALYLSDQNVSLAIAGNTAIRGDAHLPKAGVKSGFVNGSGFLGDKFIEGEMKLSTPKLPSIDKQRLEALARNFYLSRPALTVEGSHIQPFSDSTVFLVGNTLYLDNISLFGNIKVIARDSLLIGASAKLEDVLIFAPKITIENGFRGKIQVFATKSIIIEEDCQLEYPSVIGLVKDQKIDDRPRIDIGEKSHIQGSILVYQKHYSRYPPELKIREDALIEGQVWADASVDLRGRINGHISCASFILTTSSSIYNNHLYNAIIDRKSLSKHYLSPLISTGTMPTEIAQWIKYEN